MSQKRTKPIKKNDQNWNYVAEFFISWLFFSLSISVSFQFYKLCHINKSFTVLLYNEHHSSSDILITKFYPSHATAWKIPSYSLCNNVTALYTQALISHSTHNIYYSLNLHVSPKARGHLQGAIYFINWYSIHCKQSYVNRSNVHIGIHLHLNNINIMLFNLWLVIMLKLY